MTFTRDARVSAAAVVVFLVAATSKAKQEPDGFRFHGYLRSGFGVADDGEPQEAFKAPNTLAKYRLGNETEAYLETTFAYGVRPEDDVIRDGGLVHQFDHVFNVLRGGQIDVERSR